MQPLSPLQQSSKDNLRARRWSPAKPPGTVIYCYVLLLSTVSSFCFILSTSSTVEHTFDQESIKKNHNSSTLGPGMIWTWAPQAIGQLYHTIRLCMCVRHQRTVNPQSANLILNHGNLSRMSEERGGSDLFRMFLPPRVFDVCSFEAVFLAYRKFMQV